MISCVLLSAGYSSRFGSPKACAPFQGKTLIEHLQENLITSFVDEVVVVLGSGAPIMQSYLLKHKKVKDVYNKDYNFGQTSSLKAGLMALSSDCEGFLILPVDFPFIHQELVDQLIKKFLDSRPLVLIPSYQGKKGHPPIVSIRLRNEILAMENSVGLNTLFRKYKDEVALFSVEDKSVIQTFNTQEEWDRLKSDLT